MKFTSQIVAAASGSVGGCVYSRNRYGQYIRNRAVPVNPGSVFQDAVRSGLSALAVAWVSELTQVQRDGWDAYAAAVPRTDALGNTIHILGLNWYVAMNTLRLQSGLTRIDTAPIQQTGTSMTPPEPFANSPANEEFDVTFTNTDEWAGAVGGSLYVFVGQPTNITRNFMKGPFRLADRIAGAVVPPTSPATLVSPFAYAAGQKLWVRFIAQAADGRLSAPTVRSAIAA